MRVRRAIAITGSLVLPGFGHFVLGYRWRALVWWVWFYGAVPLLVFGALFTLPWLALLGLIAAVVAWVAMLVDVIRRPSSADRIPRWPALIGVAVVLILAQMVITEFRTYHSQAFTMPSGSMMPTLLVGDYVYANKLAYRLGEPRRGEVVVFQYPLDPRRARVARIVALPGERVMIRGDDVYVNGRRLEEPYVAPFRPREARPCAYAYGCGPTPVPSNSYFVMGDNRDNSHDSRYWGFLARGLLVGRVGLLYWSWDGEAKWPRWSRIGRRV